MVLIHVISWGKYIDIKCHSLTPIVYDSHEKYIAYVILMPLTEKWNMQKTKIYLFIPTFQNIDPNMRAAMAVKNNRTTLYSGLLQ
jgi:hypothetical protein